MATMHFRALLEWMVCMVVRATTGYAGERETIKFSVVAGTTSSRVTLARMLSYSGVPPKVGRVPSVISSAEFEGVDRIDFSFIDANALVAGNQAFAFIGSAAFSGAGQLRFEVDASGNAIVQANVNGDFAADLEIELRSFINVTAGDFVI